MIPLPKPRSFWDYALFALLLASLLMCLFRVETSDRVGWSDASLALIAAVLCVLPISILARRSEKPSWTVQPTWRAKLLFVLGVVLLIFGARYADAYFLHPKDLTPDRFRRDMLLGVVLLVAVFAPLRKRTPFPF
jgi:drug/metabolite transporter (DMT)-like permease